MHSVQGLILKYPLDPGYLLSPLVRDPCCIHSGPYYMEDAKHSLLSTVWWKKEVYIAPPSAKLPDSTMQFDAKSSHRMQKDQPKKAPERAG